MAELGCLVVSPAYRKQGHGDAMLCFLERTAIAAGVRCFFALSTHTMQWFGERGFTQVDLDFLPEARRALYDPSRNSKIYQKQLGTVRAVDAQARSRQRRLSAVAPRIPRPPRPSQRTAHPPATCRWAARSVRARFDLAVRGCVQELFWDPPVYDEVKAR